MYVGISVFTNEMLRDAQEGSSMVAGMVFGNLVEYTESNPVHG